MGATLTPMDGVTKKTVQTNRLAINCLQAGSGDVPILFVHGNASSAAFWEETMLALPTQYRAYACDLRGYGETEPKPVDATKGLDDMADDVVALVDTLGLKEFHIVGHSMGGGVVMKVALRVPERIMSMTWVDTMSPYGFSGSKGDDGVPCHEDGAPAGAGGVNPEFIQLLGEGYTGTDEQMAPRNVFRQFYVKPPFVPEREDALLASMLSTHIGEDWYPGDVAPSAHWPTVGPGTKGVVNAFSRKYFDASGIVDLSSKPPILWIRGADDLIVSDNSMFDIAALGAMGAVPGWPGADECPPQPMIKQIDSVLSRYESGGGTVSRVVIPDSGHSPFIDKPADFNKAFHGFLSGV